MIHNFKSQRILLFMLNSQIITTLIMLKILLKIKLLDLKHSILRISKNHQLGIEMFQSNKTNNLLMKSNNSHHKSTHLLLKLKARQFTNNNSQLPKIIMIKIVLLRAIINNIIRILLNLELVVQGNYNNKKDIFHHLIPIPRVLLYL